ncbi:MAG: amidase [Betaproteobacteria bacterium]|nr:MAG: amidase [Betaproteobacteria bacterium]
MKSLAQHLSAALTHPSDIAHRIDRQIAAAKDASGEGIRVFLGLDEGAIRTAAAASQTRYTDNAAGPLDGITISIKDLFDVAGEVTAAGSIVLRSRPPATADAPAVARLRAAGVIPFGRTNMTEFAYSGVGVNPHFGTPRNVWGRGTDGSGRIPGGSSSGGAVSVADGFCDAALGSDTGGSVRIPAAFNGLVGFKPTAFRVPVQGAIPLSYLHDSVGPIANSVDCCARIDAVLAGERYAPQSLRNLKAIRLLKPVGTLWNGLDREVQSACDAAVERLRASGVDIVEQRCEPLEAYFKALAQPSAAHTVGRLSEATDWHERHVNVNGAGYDQRVWKRIQQTNDTTRGEVSHAIAYRRLFGHAMHDALAGFDAIVTPTLACIAPSIQSLIDDEALFFATNARILRNTSWVNLMDGCAITVPCHASGDAPVGLQLVGRHAADPALLGIAASLERTIRISK